MCVHIRVHVFMYVCGDAGALGRHCRDSRAEKNTSCHKHREVNAHEKQQEHYVWTTTGMATKQPLVNRRKWQGGCLSFLKALGMG